MRTALLTLGLAALAIAGCTSPRPATEMIIEVDGDDGVRDRTDQIRVEVYGRARSTDVFPATPLNAAEYPAPIDGARWGPRLVLFPEGRDALRSYRAVAIALDDRGVEVTRTSLISGYVDGVSLRFRLYLQSSCIGVDCSLIETCRDGSCVPAEVDPEDLLDGGRLTMDGGVMDAGSPGGCDGGCDDGMDCTNDSCVGGACIHEVDCDDSVTCTLDACDGSGACEHTPMDTLCTDTTDCTTGSCDAVEGCTYVPDVTQCDDDDDCTADSCDVDTGCQHDPLTDTACDDGIFCNGIDRCAAGVCNQHAGNPCPVAASCDEPSGACTNCVTNGCPPTTTGPYGGCVSTGPCTGERTATTTSYTCNTSTGNCDAVSTPDVDTVTCTTARDGVTCATPTCTTSGACMYPGPCAESGTAPTTCIPHECASGVCADRPGVPGGGTSCSRFTDGDSCGTCLACFAGGCSVSTCTPDGGSPMDSGLFDAPDAFDAPAPFDALDAPLVAPDVPTFAPDSSCVGANCCFAPSLCTGARTACCPGSFGADSNGCAMAPCPPP